MALLNAGFYAFARIGVEIGFDSPTSLFAKWTDPNTQEIGYVVTHYDYTQGERVAAESAPDTTSASGFTATVETGFYFNVGARGPAGLLVYSDWATPSDRDGDGIPDYLERKGQTIITGTYDSSADSWDTDGDGLSDYDEVQYYHTNPNATDTDGDSLPDFWEVSYGFNPLLADEASADYDGDGLSTLRECNAGTNPYAADSDDDGLNDKAEVDTFGTNPMVADSDGDALNDGPEVFTYNTNPLSADSDGDGLPDGWEVTYGLNPLAAADASLDPDGDTLNNLQEYTNSTSPLKVDTDNDGLTDAEELQLGTSGAYWDSDYDGMSDAYEVRYGLNSANAADANSDLDNDGQNNFQEYKLGTNPNLADSDGDGVSDSVEASSGADPLDRSDAGQPPLPNQQVDFALQIRASGKTLVGNCAVCHNLQAQVGGRLLADGESIKLRRDKAYEIKLIDKPTEWTNAGGEPPHSNSAKFTLWPKLLSGQAMAASSDGKKLTVTKSGSLEYYIDNDSNLLAQDKTWDDNVLKLSATVGLADLDVIHPATGELSEDKEDSGDGGYVPINRSIETPVTKLLLRSAKYVAGNNGKFRVKFDAAGRYLLFKDAARKQVVMSEQTEFDPQIDTTLYFEGLKKSAVVGGEKVTLQVGLNNQWLDSDSLRVTVVQAEVPVMIRSFIPYLWTTPYPDFINPTLTRVVAKGDNRSISIDPSAGSRLTQSVVLTPFSDISKYPDAIDARREQAGYSIHYTRASVVPVLEYANLHGYTLLGSPIIDAEGQGRSLLESYNYLPDKVVRVHLRGVDGALPTLFQGIAPQIRWMAEFKVDISDPLTPTLIVKVPNSRRTGFPANEILVQRWNGEWLHAYTFTPSLDRQAGITWLYNDGADDSTLEPIMNSAVSLP